jgi:NADH-quinone oxidoreductase subunit L
VETIILFAPLVGALICGFGWKVIGEAAAQWTATGLLFLSALLSWIVFLTFDGDHAADPDPALDRERVARADWAIRLDRLTAIMLIVITTVSALVHLYSFGYMAHDDNFREGESYRPRFFAYLSFFTFAMLMLVTADNLVQLFFGWEGVGLASYLLIGFYYRKPRPTPRRSRPSSSTGWATSASRSASSRCSSWSTRSTSTTSSRPRPELRRRRSVPLDDRLERGGADRLPALHRRDGQVGAALPAHLAARRDGGADARVGADPCGDDGDGGGVPRLPDVAAVRVRADAKTFIVFIGACTAFFAATVGLVQNDIKRVIAYSTCSQLGYMFVAAGVGVYSVAMFHLFTHAFFKAMLFLGAGSVIHAMHHEQDMRNYGGLRHKIPYTFWAMLIGTLAITGVGHPADLHRLRRASCRRTRSSRAPSRAARQASMFAFWVLVLSALFTSFYSWRLIFLTFFGEPRGDHHTHDHAHESPKTMLIPLGVLALGAVFAGMVWHKDFFGTRTRWALLRRALRRGRRRTARSRPRDAEAACPAEGTPGGPRRHDEVLATRRLHGEHHAFTGCPGEGAIYTRPTTHVLDDAH